MNFRNRFVRLVTALAVAGAVAVQIPIQGAGTAIAQPSYPIDDRGDFFKNITQAGGLALIAYGIINTSRGGGATINAPRASASKPIYDVAAGRLEDFSEIKRLVDLAGLQSALRADGPYTFFAPNNLGLGKLTPEQATELTNPANREKLVQLLKFHIVSGRYTIADLKKLADGTALTTLAGESVTITNTGGLKINGIPVIEDDIPASNGWIHPIQSALPSPESDKSDQ